MNRWRGIIEFVSVVEAGSFSKAASNLDVGVSQVSKRVTELESRLGTRLLHRSTRLVKPSKQGEVYYESCKKILNEFNKAEDRISIQQDGPTGKLKICYIGGSRPPLQVEVLASFIKRYPDISLEVLFADEMPNLLEEGVDVALGVGDLDETSYQKLRVAWVDFLLCASPEFIVNYGAPEKPSDLEDIPCIINTSNIWRMTNGEDYAEVDVTGPWESTNMRSCINASISGLGVFMVPSFTLDEEVNAGRLVPVLDKWFVRKPLWALYPQDDYVPAKVTLLRDFLRDVLGYIAEGDEANIAPSFNEGSINLFEDFVESLEREDLDISVKS